MPAHSSFCGQLFLVLVLGTALGCGGENGGVGPTSVPAIHVLEVIDLGPVVAGAAGESHANALNDQGTVVGWAGSRPGGFAWTVAWITSRV